MSVNCEYKVFVMYKKRKNRYNLFFTQANAITESFCDGANDENMKQNNGNKCNLNIIIENMDILIDLFQKFNQQTYDSYKKLNLGGKHIDISQFTYPENDANEYKENVEGECIISNIDFVPYNHCHIFEVNK